MGAGGLGGRRALGGGALCPPPDDVSRAARRRADRDAAHRRRAGAAIAPPWCGTPEPDAAGNLPDDLPTAPDPELPAHPLLRDRVHARQHRRCERRPHDGRALRQVRSRPRQVPRGHQRAGQSQAQDYKNWQKVRRYALGDPERAQDMLAKVGDDVKVPLFIQGGIHGNEYEGVDAAMQVIERLALTCTGRIPRSTRSSTRRSSSSTRSRTPTAGSPAFARTGTGSTSTATSSRSRSRKSRARSHSSRSGCHPSCSISTATSRRR